MAGLEHFRIALDPAFQKLSATNVNRAAYFRWTPRTARLTFIFAVAVPSVLLYAGYQTDGKWDLRGKRKGDVLSEY